MRNKNIINYIKVQRLNWFAHVGQTTNDTMVKKLYECTPLCKTGRRKKIRWEKSYKRRLKNYENK